MVYAQEKKVDKDAICFYDPAYYSNIATMPPPRTVDCSTHAAD